jgi:hypothetical protein
MKISRLVRVGTALVSAVVIGTALPSIVAAQQASGANAPVGVTVPAQDNQPAPAPVQLPRTGNPDASTNDSLPGLVIGGAAGLLLLVSRGPWMRDTVRRWRK